MDVPRYLDFDLLIERAGTRYKARVINAPSGTASRTFDFPFNRDQLQIFLLSAIGLGRNRRVRRMEAPEMKAVKTFGGGLFETVFAEDLLECLRLSLYDARSKSAGLRIRLRLDDTIDSPASDANGTDEEMTGVALCDVPWEFMFDAGGGGFLSLSIESPVVRYQDLNTPIEHISVEPPLRLLVAICAPSNAPELDVEHERAKVEEALGELVEARLIEIDWLEHGTLTQLQRALYTDYHAFHFIGHGGYDERAQTGALLFENANGFRDTVGAEFLRTLFLGKRNLQLALLNACEGSRTDPRDPFAGVAQSLVRGGVAAVIAMQFEISDDAAIALSSEFYSALAHGFPVDAALSEARKAVYTNVSPVEWAIPVLYLRSPDASIFDVTAPPPPDGVVEEKPVDEPKEKTPPTRGRGGDDGGNGNGDRDADGGGVGRGDESKKEKRKEEKKPFFEGLSRTQKLIAAAIVALIVLVVALVVLVPGGEPPGGAPAGGDGSLDGDIVFVRDGELLSVDPTDEATPTPLFESAQANDFAPSISPDQATVVFGGGPSEPFDIWRADTDGTGLTNLTESPTASEETADWSPDGSRIVFDRVEDGDFDIWMMNADGSNPHPITSGDAIDKRPDWSSDDLIVFERNRDIYVMDPAGRDARLVYGTSTSHEQAPVWSPGSDRIAFLGDGEHLDEYGVWIVRADGTGAKELTPGVTTARTPAWSPEGDQIAYTARGTNGYDLFIVDAAGKDPPMTLLSSQGNDRGSTWCCF